MNNIAQKILDEKKMRSPFLTLASGEAKIGIVKEVAETEKDNFNKTEKVTVIRLIMDVAYPGFGMIRKNFDTNNSKFLESFIDSGADVGDEIEIYRDGEGPKTSYRIRIITKSGEEPSFVEGYDNDQNREINIEDIPL